MSKQPDWTKQYHVPEADEPGTHPEGFMRWNPASLCFEYHLDDEKVMEFSAFAMRMLVEQFLRGKETGRIEVVSGMHSGHIVLLSVPLSRLRGYVKEEYGVDI